MTPTPPQTRCICGQFRHANQQTCGRIGCMRRLFELQKEAEDKIEWGLKGLSLFEKAIGKK